MKNVVSESGCPSDSRTQGQFDRLMDQNEVAEILCVSVKTLEYWRWKGGGPVFVKIGKLARYRESDVRAYIEQLGN